MSRTPAKIACLLVATGLWAADQGDAAGFAGTWRGTSKCVNREVAPNCKDETVVYEVRPSERPKTVMLAADKIVDGQRLPMGELEFVFSEKEKCWVSEIKTPRVHGVWCLVVDRSNLTGGLRELPQNAEVRRVNAKRE